MNDVWSSDAQKCIQLTLRDAMRAWDLIAVAPVAPRLLSRMEATPLRQCAVVPGNHQTRNEALPMAKANVAEPAWRPDSDDL
jgi:hypothetical protein